MPDRLLENAIKANNNKLPTRAQVSAEVRKIQYTGLSGKVKFDSKGDNEYAKIFVYKFASESYPGVLQKELAGKP